MNICVLDGKKIKNAEMLHKVLAETLRFPDWYGRNLDALYDCLTDMREETEIRFLNESDLEENLGKYAGRLEKVIRRAAKDNAKIKWKCSDSVCEKSLKESGKQEESMSRLKNGILWEDTDGNPIHAHGGCILFHEGYYYWYGEDRREDFYVSCYRSGNLADWEFCRHVLTARSRTQGYRVRTDIRLENADGGKVNLERPKVLYNEKTGKFVMWVHYENGKDYLNAAVGIATCDTPDGDFVYHGHFNPYGYMSWDCTLFQDEDGTAYFISAARDNADLHVYRLSEDYMNVDALVHRLWQGEYREAPAVVKIKDRYYMLSSYCTGWAPNQGKYAVADSMEGRWSPLTEIGDETTYHSQPAFILQKDGRILYYGDRWDADNYFNSGYVVYPLMEKDGRLVMEYVEEIEI